MAALTLAELVTAAMMIVAGWGSPTGSRHGEQTGPHPLARAIASEVEHARALPFDGPEAPRATAMMLVSIAWHESSFRAEVFTCKVVGSAGERGAFQIKGLRHCPSHAAGARMAIGTLNAARAREGATTVEALVYGYMGQGRGDVARARVGARMTTFALLCDHAEVALSGLLAAHVVQAQAAPP